MGTEIYFLYDSTEPCGLSRTICACSRQTEQASYLCLARWLIEQRFPRTCGQQIADRSLPVAEMLFRIGTLSRWVRAAASLSPGFNPAVRGGLGENPPTHARPARKQAKPARKSRQSTFLFAPRSRVIFLSPQAIKKHPYKRGSVSTLRLDNLRAWAEMGPGRFPHCVGEMSRSDKRGRLACGVARRGVQGRFPHCVGEMSRSDKGKIPPRGGGNVMK